MDNGGPSIRQLQRRRTPHSPPGLFLLVVVGLAAVVLVCIFHGWWPSRYGRIAWAETFLVGGAAALVLLVAGAVWALKTFFVIGEDRRWSWWVAAAPIAVAAAAISTLLVPRSSFDDSRAEFDSVARQLIAEPDTTREQFEIGRFDIRSAWVGDGVVYFDEDGGLALTTHSGWAYSPEGEPGGFDDFTAQHLGGPWYEFTAVWRD